MPRYESASSSGSPYIREDPPHAVESSEHLVWGNGSSTSSNSNDSGKRHVFPPSTDTGHDDDGHSLSKHVVWGTVGENSSSSSEDFVKKERQEADFDEVLFLQEDNPEEELDARKALEHKYRCHSKEELVGIVPFDNGVLTSIGSLQHDVGECIPCPFLLRNKGCKRSHWCGLCHFNHGTEGKIKRSRPTKGERLRYKKCLGRVTQGLESAGDVGSFDLDSIDQHLVPSIQKDPEKKKKFIKQLRTHVANLQTGGANSQPSSSSSTKLSL